MVLSRKTKMAAEIERVMSADSPIIVTLNLGHRISVPRKSNYHMQYETTTGIQHSLYTF